MAEEQKKKQKRSLKERLKARYCVVVINEKTLAETMHLRLSLWNMMLLFVAMLLLALLLFGLLIWYTPLRNYLPGNTQTIRENLVYQNARLDSLEDVIYFQNEYLDVLKSVISGNVEPDSVRQPLDSAYIRDKQDLLADGSVVIDQFMADYEGRQNDNLTFFDQASQQNEVQSFFRPTSGIVVTHFSATGYRGVRMQTANDQHVSAVLNGTIVSLTYTVQEGWTMLIQHSDDFLSIYGHLQKPLKRNGDSVSQGEAVGLTSDKELFTFQLWKKGVAMNPEDLIAF